MKVYLIVEFGSWDYEENDKVDTMIFATYEKAKEEFIKRVEQTKEDMFNGWFDIEDKEQYTVEEDIDDKNKYCSYSIYESGDYTRLHNDITLQEMEVIE